MKRTVFTASLAVLCLVGTTSGQVFNNNHYFQPSPLADYKDLATVKATEQVNPNELITVGFAIEQSDQKSHDIVIVKSDVRDGTVIWANRYGLKEVDERAYGLDVTYDGKDVIVVGTAQDEQNLKDWNALAMRIEISTGKVVWVRKHGHPRVYEEWRMIEKTYSSNLPSSPTYFLAGNRSNNNQESEFKLYAGAIYENGFEQYLRVFLENSSNQRADDFAYTMVQNQNDNFILAGTRYKVNEPSHIFTIGIDPTTGTLSDKYRTHGIKEDDQIGGAIAEVGIGSDRFYTLAFTTSNPAEFPNLKSTITVMLLDINRSPIWVKYFWQKDYSRNKGLSIYQNQEEPYLVDVYVGVKSDHWGPGLMQLQWINGDVRQFIRYNLGEEPKDKYATSMVQTPKGYFIKALHLQNRDGYMLAGLDVDVRTECSKEAQIEEKEIEPYLAFNEYISIGHGAGGRFDLVPKEVKGETQKCDGSGSIAFRLSATETSELEESALGFQVYPNPITQDGTTLQLAYTLPAEKKVEISVFNALGQETILHELVLSAGSQVLELDNALLSPGLNLLTIRSEGSVLFQTKVVLQ